MPDAVSWAAIGVAAALVGAFVMQRLGIIQIGLRREGHGLNKRHEAHSLNRRLGSPKITSEIRIEQRHDNGPQFPPWFYLLTTISNQGELAAKHLKGEWKLTSVSGEIAERTIPINLDWLGKSQPYKLRECRLESGLAPEVWTPREGSHNIELEVALKLEYFGHSENQPEHYRARYQFDHNSQQMVRVEG